ncbi:MAG: hypothetical protein A2X78_03890 [Gammaproteobacteria bacterium GWE2_37_16]|nr:MAG: hypothetical protein A2X78_03890 [Gammaproteobacteria bacterium GWE2_37_16]
MLDTPVRKNTDLVTGYAKDVGRSLPLLLEAAKRYDVTIAPELQQTFSIINAGTQLTGALIQLYTATTTSSIKNTISGQETGEATPLINAASNASAISDSPECKRIAWAKFLGHDLPATAWAVFKISTAFGYDLVSDSVKDLLYIVDNSVLAATDLINRKPWQTACHACAVAGTIIGLAIPEAKTATSLARAITTVVSPVGSLLGKGLDSLFNHSNRSAQTVEKHSDHAHNHSINSSPS